LKICYLFNIYRTHLKIVRRRTKITLRVSRSESRNYWTSS